MESFHHFRFDTLKEKNAFLMGIEFGDREGIFIVSSEKELDNSYEVVLKDMRLEMANRLFNKRRTQ